MEIQDGMSSRGAVTVLIEGPRGRRAYEARNRLTNAYLSAQTQWACGVPNLGAGAALPPSQIQLGTGSNSSGPQPTDTALWTPTAGTLKACNAISVYAVYYAQFQAFYATTDPAATFTEAGLLDANSTLLAHVVLSGVNKASDETLTVIWKVLVQGN